MWLQKHGHAVLRTPQAGGVAGTVPAPKLRRGVWSCLLSARRSHSPGPGPCASFSWVLNRTPVNPSARVRLAVTAGDAAPLGPSEAFLLGTPMAQTTGPEKLHLRKTHATGNTGGKEGAGLEEKAEPERGSQ